MFFKKISQNQNTEKYGLRSGLFLGAIRRLGESSSISGGPKAQMLAHTSTNYTKTIVLFLKILTFSTQGPKLNMALYACLTHIAQSNKS